MPDAKGSVPTAFTEAPWRHNVAGGAPAAVTHRGVVYKTKGPLVPMRPRGDGRRNSSVLGHG